MKKYHVDMQFMMLIASLDRMDIHDIKDEEFIEERIQTHLENFRETLRVKNDYYGNKSYGKRAYWVLDNNNNKTNEMFFVRQLDEFRKRYNVIIVE